MLRVMQYFGLRNSAPVYDDATKVATPVGEVCGHCGESIEDGDDGFILPSYPRSTVAFHYVCHLRGVFGCVEHQQRCRVARCDGKCRDDPNLTAREAAEAAVAYYEWAHGIASVESK